MSWYPYGLEDNRQRIYVSVCLSYYKWPICLNMNVQGEADSWLTFVKWEQIWNASGYSDFQNKFGMHWILSKLWGRNVHLHQIVIARYIILKCLCYVLVL